VPTGVWTASGAAHAPRLALAALALTSLLAAGAVLADPASPPGGSHPVRRIGYNRAGYPALHMTADAPRGAPGAPGLAASAAPNPFRTGVRVRLGLAPGATARIRFFTPQGRLVRELAAGADGSLLWDGRDSAGRSVPPGLYLWRAVAGGRTATGRVVRLR
jgi:hypothetical protein